MFKVEPIYNSITKDELIRIRAVADIQFGKGCGKILFPEDDITVTRSKKTGKVKNIYHNGKLIATLRPKDGFLALGIEGAKRLVNFLRDRYIVVVKDEVTEFIKKGRNLFSKHVLKCDQEIRPGEEVIVIDSRGNVIGVGRAILSGKEMKHFKNGVAVKIRSGIDEENES